MAINPVERRMKTSFITGIILGLVAAAIIAAILLLQLANLNKQLQASKEAGKSVPVAAKNITANSELSPDDLVNEVVVTQINPQDIVGPDHLSGATPINETTTDISQPNANKGKKKKLFSTVVRTESAPTVSVSNSANTSSNASSSSSQSTTTQQSGQTDSNSSTTASTQNSSQSAAVATTTDSEGKVKYVALIDIPKGSIITKRMIIAKEDNTLNKENTLREVEYSNLLLPSQLQEGETIDIRLAFPNGQDFVVLTKKYVDKTDATSIWIKVNEEEIVKMNGALIESYLVDGAKLYAVKYTQAGIQKPLNANYPVNAEVYKLIANDPNVPLDAKQTMQGTYNPNSRESINKIVQEAKMKDGNSRISSAVQKEIKQRSDKRLEFVEGKPEE